MEVTQLYFETIEGTMIPFTSLYEYKSHLGSGGFGDVYEVIRKSNYMRMAIKVSETE